MSENRLSRETSPYLLQHQTNPVHWWAWGPEALDEAKRTGKPILLSVGYAACHWCHVMAHESFEDEATAAVMNELFVNIKVDREERPDIDAIYMGALHKLGEQGGWPLTMFLDSAARPFWGGTYFPPESRYGRPGFQHVLREVARIFRDDPAKITHNATALVQALATPAADQTRLAISDEVLSELTGRMVRAIDPVHGGLKGAPKFPQWSFLWLMWRGTIRYGQEDGKTALVETLRHICQGGIYDHLAGGFARYSVDERWLVPHFEKMLYDNALLIDLMTEAWRETQEPLFRARIEETVGWLQREMIADGGGFAASLDADSEGEEGKFTVWSRGEVMEVLGPEDGRRFCAIYDITEPGNFEGHNIPNRLTALEWMGADEEGRLAGLRAKLLARRDGRIRPGWDDKVLADWNGLMIAALSRASVVFERPDWLAMAERAFGFVIERMRVASSPPHCGDGSAVEGIQSLRLWHSFRAGQTRAPATAADYANMISAAIRLYEATTKSGYLESARALEAALDKHHWLQDAGGYATSADDTADVIVRLKSAHDDAVPNANGTMITALMQLYLLTGEEPYRKRAAEITDAFAREVGDNALGHCGLLAGCFDLLAPSHIVIVGVGAAADNLASALHRVALPGALEQKLPDTAELPSSSPIDSRTAISGQAAAYVCAGMSCAPPAVTGEALVTQLKLSRQA